MEPQKWIQMAISCQFGVPCQLLGNDWCDSMDASAKLVLAKRREFSGMIHWLSINVIIPATPGNPTHPATLRKTHAVPAYIAHLSRWTLEIGPADRQMWPPNVLLYPLFIHGFSLKPQQKTLGIPKFETIHSSSTNYIQWWWILSTFSIFWSTPMSPCRPGEASAKERSAWPSRRKRCWMLWRRRSGGTNIHL